jgi:hypothetical protein
MSFEKKRDFYINTLKCNGIVKFTLLDLKNIKIRLKIVDCVFIKHAYNISAYLFLVHK